MGICGSKHLKDQSEHNSSPASEVTNKHIPFEKATGYPYFSDTSSQDVRSGSALTGSTKHRSSDQSCFSGVLQRNVTPCNKGQPDEYLDTVTADSNCPDKFIAFTRSGGNIDDLIANNAPPAGWNDILLQKYPVTCKPIKVGGDRSIYRAVIHVNDEELSTKRHFLAFHQILVHRMEPAEFIKWCKQHEMYNTVTDYIALYVASRFHGHGSACLRGLARDRNAIKVDITDRFFAPNGVFRAIVFHAHTLADVRRLVNSYLQRLTPSARRSARCGFPENVLEMYDGELRRNTNQMVKT